MQLPILQSPAQVLGKKQEQICLKSCVSWDWARNKTLFSSAERLIFTHHCWVRKSRETAPLNMDNRCEQGISVIFSNSN